MDSLGRVKEWRGGEGRGDRGNGGGEGFLPRKTQYCTCPKIHTAPTTNAFARARKMHLAALPERMLCADNASKTHRFCEPGLCRLLSDSQWPTPKDYRETLCPTPARPETTARLPGVPKPQSRTVLRSRKCIFRRLQNAFLRPRTQWSQNKCPPMYRPELRNAAS